MRLILREEVDHLGRRGDIVNVARGYARNFLLPKRLAMEVTDDNLRIIDKERKVYEAKLAKERSAAEELAKVISSVELSFIRKAHDDGDELYGSVSPSDIGEALELKGLKIEKRKIAISSPIKSVGEYTVSVKLHPDVIASFPVTVSKDTQSEDKDTTENEV